jgi:TatD DNase family protein
MTIIDTHVHIDQLEDLDACLERAKDSGLSDIVAMSVDLTSMHKVLEIAAQPKAVKVHPALGIHPGTVKPEEQAAAFDFLKNNISKAVAIGETGLDYSYKWARKDELEKQRQRDYFQFHLQLAKETGLPIVIHGRGSYADCLSMTKAAGITKALFHWYSGTVDILEEILDAGFYVSTSISVGYSPESRAAMSRAPLERILIETDSPVRYRDGDNLYMAEPKDVTRTLASLAELKGLDKDTVLAQVNKNARDFFRI